MDLAQPVKSSSKRGGLDFDKDGKMAQEGLISTAFRGFVKLEYHNLKPPKSLGMEWFYNEMLPVLIAHKGLSLENMMCTSVDYIATTIVADLPVGSTLFSGGGARNKYLIRRILKMVDGTDRKIIISEAPMLDAKEAYGFAFLGLLRWLLMDNVLNSVTGASGPKF